MDLLLLLLLLPLLLIPLPGYLGSIENGRLGESGAERGLQEGWIDGASGRADGAPDGLGERLLGLRGEDDLLLLCGRVREGSERIGDGGLRLHRVVNAAGRGELLLRLQSCLSCCCS